MCNEGIKITIEEWAGDNNINLTDNQVEELVYAIDVAYDMSLPYGYGIGQIETKEHFEIRYLKSQIDLLQRFISSKGYHITLFDDHIERLIIHNSGDRSYTLYETFR